MDLLELAERCEAATGWDRHLDADIVEAIEMHPDEFVGPCYPRFTASLDAAMTLVPDAGVRSWVFLQSLLDERWQAAVTLDDHEAMAATPALALCAAALRARAHLPKAKT